MRKKSKTKLPDPVKYLIFGRGGWLAHKLKHHFKGEGGAVISGANVTNFNEVVRDILVYQPQIVINAAGVTGKPNIDWCETSPGITLHVNTVGAINVALASVSTGRFMLHLSSGCIFEGTDAVMFDEEDPTTPPSYYSKTKAWADEILKDMPVCIVRLRMPIDTEPSPRNLIDKLVGYDKIIEARNSVTIIPDLIEAIHRLIESRSTGIYHVVNPGVVSHREILDLYREYVDPALPEKEFIDPEELYKQGLAKARRSNCVLSTQKLKKTLGWEPPEIHGRLIEVLKQYKEHHVR